MENNAHKILGIGQRASEKDIKTAYKRRLKRLRELYPDAEENEEFKAKAAEYAKAKEDILKAIKRNAEIKGLSEEAYAKQQKQNRLFVLLVVVIIAAIAAVAALSVNGVIGSGPSVNKGGVVAKIGDTEIKQGLVDGLSAYMNYANYGQRLDSFTEEDAEVAKNSTLVSIIVPAELIREHLEAEGKANLDKEAKATIKAGIDKAYGDATTNQVLREQFVPRTSVKYFFELQEYYKIFKEEVMAADPVTDEQAQEYYDENDTYFNMPEQKTASHILIADPDHTPEKLTEIEDILARAEAGEDFAELAKEYSEDEGSAESGGALGSFGEENNFVPEFSEAAWALQNVDDISGVVETEFGYHIIKLTGITEATSTPFEDVKDDIVSYLEDERTGEAADALKDEIKVEYFGYVDPDTGEPPVVTSALKANVDAAAAVAGAIQDAETPDAEDEAAAEGDLPDEDIPTDSEGNTNDEE
ncbi:MAG: peptidylprolyl isomerase [Clostridiales Family XIII bacterium]|jgi:parvulin-like peptidyl-prolyl isomerase|nr:peptidylprolyl isomerase [Clostridiales Family XIII bacterium]